MSILSKISEFESSFMTNNYGAQVIVARSENIDDIKRYIETIFNSLKEGNISVLEEAKSVALPLSYRFALDDTSNNYRISSFLKEEIYRIEFPKNVVDCIDEEIDWICQTAFGFSYKSIDGLLESIFDDLNIFSNNLLGNWYVYGRSKSISSILAKLSKFRSKKKLPKNKSDSTLQLIDSILDRFERHIKLRLLNGNNNVNLTPYQFSDLKWLIPDFVAFTIQLREEDHISNRNLGSAKSKYKSVFNKFLKVFPSQVFFGPSYSSSWHINRMVCYIEYKVGSSIKIPFELFIRTDYDYFVGYGNYWRYKGIDLFIASNQEKATSKKEFNKKVKNCKSFSEVQETIFYDVTTGQLDLF